MAALPRSPLYAFAHHVPIGTVKPHQKGIGGHRCSLFVPRNLLLDKKWLGANGVRIELIYPPGGYGTTDKEDRERVLKEREKLVEEFIQGFEEAGLHADVRFEETARPGERVPTGLIVANVTHEAKVQPGPVLALGQHVLWVEPNKIDNLPQDDLVQSFTEHLARDRLVAELSHLRRDLMVVRDHPRRPGGHGRSSKSGRRLQAWLHSAAEAVTVVLQNQETLDRVDVCKVCDRVIRATSNVDQSQTEAKIKDDIERLTQRMQEMQVKLGLATGSKNKQKRKKLQRKIRDVKELLEQAHEAARERDMSDAVQEAALHGAGGASLASLPLDAAAVPAGAAATSADA